MVKEAIVKMVHGLDLTEAEMVAAMEEIVSGDATQAQIGAFVTALRIKGEAVDEIIGAVRVMRTHTVRLPMDGPSVNLDRDEINMDEETMLNTTGPGNGTHTFNVSTASALVVAAAGVKVVKHGYRAVSSRCGSADVVESLGVNLQINGSSVARCLREIGIGFLYVPPLLGTMKHAAAPRQEIGLRTLFNLLGPLTNPGGAPAQVLGVYTPERTETLARVLHRLGTQEAFVVYGQGTLDEISICGPTQVTHLKEGRLETFTLEPEDLGFSRAPVESIKGGNALENAGIIREILQGRPGPRRDVVLMNAAAALMAAGVADGFTEGIRQAEASIDSGRARAKLEALIDFTQQCRPFLRKVL